MNKIACVILLITLLVSCNVEKNSCSKLLNEEVRLPERSEDFEIYLNEFVDKYQQVFLCEFDTIDYLIMLGPEKNFLQLSYASMCLKEDSRKIYYREFVNTYKEFQQTDEYAEIRAKLEKAYKLFCTEEISQTNWGESIEGFLTEMGFSKEQILETKARKEVEMTPQKQEAEISSEMKYLVEGLPVYIDYEKGKSKAKELNKKMIVYFTGKTCANSRQMENMILTDKQVHELINENYVMICLYVDDRTTLAENEVYYSKILERNIERKGQIYLEMQKRDYNMASQPFFVILNTKGKEVVRETYTQDIEKFKKFLRKG